MNVKHWIDQAGLRWREISHSNLQRMQELKKAYEKVGWTGTVEPSLALGLPKYILTVCKEK